MEQTPEGLAAAAATRDAIKQKKRALGQPVRHGTLLEASNKSKMP
jgi:hypothetical protein